THSHSAGSSRRILPVRPPSLSMPRSLPQRARFFIFRRTRADELIRCRFQKSRCSLQHFPGTPSSKSYYFMDAAISHSVFSIPCIHRIARLVFRFICVIQQVSRKQLGASDRHFRFLVRHTPGLCCCGVVFHPYFYHMGRRGFSRGILDWHPHSDSSFEYPPEAWYA